MGKSLTIFTDISNSAFMCICIFHVDWYQSAVWLLGNKKLCKALNDVGYKAEQYVGWVFMQDELPVHHSFVVLGNSIIDPTVSLLCKDIEQLERLNPGSDHETRINLMNLYKEKQFLPNHIKCIFGKVDDLYVGAPGTAEEGIKRNVLLRKEYPDHPCFQDVYNGTTAMQRMIMD